MKLMKLTKSTVKPIDEEESLKIMGDEAPVGVCIMQDGKICSFNSNFPVATGYTTDELIGRDSLEIVAPEDREMVRENTIKMLKGKFTSPYQFRVINKDGNIRWVMAAVKSVQYHGRRAILGSYMEVTERKQLEEVLKEREEKYRELANSITDVFFAMDEHLRYTYWNKASEVLTGIRAEDAIGKSLPEIFPKTPETRQAEKVYRNVLKTRQPQTFVNDYDIDGRHYIFEISAYPSRGGISVFVKDITERKQAEERLKESEQKYRTILEEMGDGYFETDLAGNITFINDALIRILGYSKEEIIGMNFRAIRPKEHVKAIFEASNRMYKTGEPLRDRSAEVICKDGRHAFAETSAFPIRNDKGEIIGFRGIHRDITERKQAEEKLKESEQQYRLLFETALDCITQINREGRYLAANPATARSLGVPLEELIGKTLFEVMPQEVAQYRLGMVRKALDEWNPQIFEDERAGRYFDHIYIPTKTSDQKEAVQAIARDITERKKMEEALRQGEERYKALFDSSVIGMFVMDAETMKIVMCNEAAVKMFGFSSVEEVIGINPVDFIVPEEKDRDLNIIMKDMFEQDLRQTHEFQAVTKDGRKGWISVTGARIMHEGRLAGLVSITNINRRKQVEEALRQSEEKHRALFSSSVIGMFVMDAETMKIAMCNKAAAKMFGFSSIEEAVGVNPLDFVHPEYRDKALEITTKEMFEQDLRRTHEYRVVNKDGREGWASVTGARMMHEGRLAGLVSITDITERKNVEKSLELQRSYFQQLFDNSPDAIIRVDIDDRVVQANKGFEALFGYPTEEINGRPISELIIPKGYREEASASAQTVSDGEVVRKELLRRCKDGRLIDVSAISYPIRFDGKLVGAYIIYSNITERKQAEEALRQSEEKYKALFDSSVTGAFVIDAETMKVVMANQAAAKMFRFSSVEEAIGLNPLDFVPPDDKASVLKLIMEELFEQDSRRTFDVRAVTRDGREIWISATGARIMHEGRLAGLISFTDITERKQAEEALRQSEERYRTMLEEMEDAYFEVDLGGHLTFVNNSVCRDLGYSREELIGMSYKGFTIEHDIESVFRVFNEVYRTGMPNKGFPWITIRKDGSHGFAETSVSPLRNDKGEIIGFRGVGRDITERKQTEEKLRRSRERYRALFDSSVTGTLVVDAETMKVLIGNQAAVKMFGFSSAEEGAGVNLLDFVPPEEREKDLELLMKEVFEQDSRRTFDLRVMTKDGRPMWISATGTRITHESRLAGLLSFTDITERKKVEEALNIQKAYFQQLFDNSPDAIIMLDINDRVVHANKGFEALFGYSAEELQGRSILELIIPEDDTEATSASLRRVFSGEIVRRETVRRRKDTSLVDVATLLYPIRLNDKVIGACFTYTDITQRKKAEAALRQSEENYKTLFDSSVIGMYVMDAETMKVVMGNRAARELAGFSSEQEGIGINPLDFVVPEDREKVLEIAINEFLQDSRGTHEVRVMDKDGRRGWLSISSARITHEGRLASLVSIMNITERKQAEEALRLSEEKYRALFDNTVIGTIVLDAETMKVAMANQAAAKIFGFRSAEEVIGTNPFDFILPEDRERFLELAKNNLFEQESRQINDLRAVTKDGREIWINTTGARIMHEGKLAGLVSFTDITEQKRQNERLILTDRLASLGELAAGTAHELNNPLTSVIGFSQLLLDKEVPDDIREDLKLIYNEAQRAAGVTKNLLTFARKHAPVKQPTQINNIIEDVLKLRTYEHEVNSIEVKKKFAPALPEIMVDSFQMQQVFMNIIINAEYFMIQAHNKGTLTITTKKWNDTVMISFADDGPGIPRENLNRIFDPFFTTKEAGKGTGLGLSISHGIVTEHSGQIYARSELGKGATIFIELPINSP
jgi:PAS domain S-box-containing protein